MPCGTRMAARTTPATRSNRSQSRSVGAHHPQPRDPPLEGPARGRLGSCGLLGPASMSTSIRSRSVDRLRAFYTTSAARPSPCAGETPAEARRDRITSARMMPGAARWTMGHGSIAPARWGRRRRTDGMSAKRTALGWRPRCWRSPRSRARRCWCWPSSCSWPATSASW